MLPIAMLWSALFSPAAALGALSPPAPRVFSLATDTRYNGT